ncbi:hypothetical protein [Xanthobacter tagetidis]|nr:hypothetical protein [Xanthobacter tagetidis]MBB6306192.1 uncharacterized protein (DUF2237 family) [Xanthobacter tagetidis]
MTLRIALYGAACGAALAMSLPAAAETPSRQQQCAAEWSKAKDAGKVPDGMTWPKFYSECAARLGAAAAGAGAAPSAAPPAAAPAAASAPAPAPAAAPAAKPAAAPASTAAKPAAGGAPSSQTLCAEEWKSAKAAGKLPAGATWPKYYSECAARLSAATPTATPAGAAAPPAAAPAAVAKPAAAPAASAGYSSQTLCAEEWKQAKASGKLPAGATWPKFYSDCAARLAAGTPAAASPAAAPAAAKPGAPAAAKPVSAAPASPAAAKPGTKPAATPAAVDDDEDTGEGVREPTPGQLAARERMKECGAQWRTQKEAGKIPDGQTWPQYWSACNKRLKAAAAR